MIYRVALGGLHVDRLYSEAMDSHCASCGALHFHTESITVATVAKSSYLLYMLFLPQCTPYWQQTHKKHIIFVSTSSKGFVMAHNWLLRDSIVMWLMQKFSLAVTETNECWFHDWHWSAICLTPLAISTAFGMSHEYKQALRSNLWESRHSPWSACIHSWAVIPCRPYFSRGSNFANGKEIQFHAFIFRKLPARILLIRN